MKFNKIILGLACLFAYVAFMCNYALCQDAKGKGSKAAVHSGSSGQTYVPAKGPGIKEDGDYDIQSAVEELKLLTTDGNKKSQVNRNLIVGTTLVNTALLLVISGLIGYGLKEKKDDNGSGQGSKSKSKSKGERGHGGDNSGSGGSGSGEDE